MTVEPRPWDRLQEILPPLSTYEFEELKNSIGQHGVLQKILILPDGRIIDGCHRWEITKGKAPYESLNLDEDSAFTLGILLNLARRNMAPEQLKEARKHVKKLALALRKTGKSQPEISKLLKIPRQTISYWEDEEGGNISIAKTGIAYIPDCRVSVPKSEYGRIYERAKSGEGQAKIAADYKISQPRVSQIVKQINKEKEKNAKSQEELERAEYKPKISLESWETWLPRQPKCELLLTDPPYETELEDVESFANSWLIPALSKVKPEGRAYVFIGSYPREIYAYLKAYYKQKNRVNIKLIDILVWTYRNTIGPKPAFDYKRNWQAILYFRGKKSPVLNCKSLTEQFSVQDINAPDARTGIQYHAWQKPDEIAERFILHSTKPGDLVLDPFAGTGTFVLVACKLGRDGRGCEISREMLKIAKKRGCVKCIR